MAFKIYFQGGLEWDEKTYETEADALAEVKRIKPTLLGGGNIPAGLSISKVVQYQVLEDDKPVVQGLFDSREEALKWIEKATILDVDVPFFLKIQEVKEEPVDPRATPTTRRS